MNRRRYETDRPALTVVDPLNNALLVTRYMLRNGALEERNNAVHVVPLSGMGVQRLVDRKR